MIHLIQAPVEFLDKFGINTARIVAFFGIAFAIAAYMVLSVDTGDIFTYAFFTVPLWLPVVTFKLFFEHWLYYVRKDYNLAQGRTTLEIKLPQEIFKSPEAMELVLTQMHQAANPDNHIQTYYDGKNPPVTALELVSRGGDVRFYINTVKKKFKNIIETQLYAQYPGIEVHELDIDYTAEIPWDPKKYGYMTFHFGLKKADAYPIKTYIDYGLDKMPKEEEKTDPITTMLEMLGSIGPGEHVWMQILITINRKTTFKEGSLKETPDWVKDAKEVIKTIKLEAAKAADFKELKEIGGNIGQVLSETDKDTIKAIQRSLGKNAFNTTIRGTYIAEGTRFNGDTIGAMVSSWRSYDDLNRNAIGVKWRTDFDWNWWQDPTGAHREHLKKDELEEYKKRTYTKRGLADGAKVMTTEELATIFHLPGKVAATPSLSRIPSKRSEAPSNLPIG